MNPPEPATGLGAEASGAVAAVAALGAKPLVAVPAPAGGTKGHLVAPPADDLEFDGVPISRSFSTLDRVLIRTAIACAEPEEDGLDPEQLRALVSEVLAMKSSRERSHFHRGFADALLGSPVAPAAGPEGAARRAWYLCGYAIGAMRGTALDGFRRLWSMLPASDVAVLRDPAADEAGDLLARVLIPRLLDAGDVDGGIDWMYRRFARLSDAVLRRVACWARDRLVGEDVAPAARVLERADRELTAAAGEPSAARAAEIRGLRRRLAIAYRCTERSSEASALVDRLLAESSDPAERAKLLGDRALLAIGRRTLVEVALPEGDERRAFLDALGRAGPILDEALATGAHAPVCRYLSALPAVAGEKGADVAEAAARLRTALNEMTASDLDFWRRTGIFGNATLYLVRLELSDGATAHTAPDAVRRLHELLASEARPSFEIVSQALEGAWLLDTPGLDAVVAQALNFWPRRTLQKLTQVLERVSGANGEVREQFRRTLVEQQERLTAAERWEAWSSLLAACMRAEPRDDEGARGALDELEELALEPEFAERLLALLDVRSRWDPAWNADDAEAARYRLQESLLRLDDARTTLGRLANKLISAGDVSGVDLVERMLELGATERDVESLRCRYAAKFGSEQPSPASTANGAGKPVRILFVGGNETQAAYEQGLVDQFRRTHPSVRIDFEFSGWGSNWNKLVDRLRPRLDHYDAIVVMRFVRTQLGRTIRKLAGARWVACTGGGREWIERALERAIELAARGPRPEGETR